MPPRHEERVWPRWIAAGLAALLCAAAAAPASGQAPPAKPGKIITVTHSPPDQVPSLGPRNAPVTIEFFADLGDGRSSGLLHVILVKLLERHPRRLRILYRLVTSGEQSNAHLEAAMEAFTQGRFREFLDAIYVGDSPASPRLADLPSLAAKAGVDRTRVEQALADGRHAAAIVANHYYRKRRHVRRTPGLLVNGVLIDRSKPRIEDLEALYDEAYARAEALRDRGVPPDQLYQRLVEEVAASLPEPIIGAGAVDGLGPGERPPLASPPVLRTPLDRGGHQRGPAAARFPIVFLCNFQTRNCGEMAELLDHITAAYPGEVRLVFRHFYDPTDRRQDRVRALHVQSLCAEAQGRFWGFYDLAFRQARQGASEAPSIEELARELELDRSAFSRCLRSPRPKTILETERRTALKAGIRHTPSVILGGRLYTGTKSFDEMAALIDRELSPGVLGRLAPD